MPGTVTIDACRYCLVPNVLTPRAKVGTGRTGPRCQARLTMAPHFLTAAGGHWADDHFVVFEDDLLQPPADSSNVLYTIAGAMAAPFRTESLIAFAAASGRSPAEFLRDVLLQFLARVRVSGDQSELRFVIDWDRLQLARSYQVCAVNALALLWPPGPLDGWRPVFLAVRHGDLDPEASANLFRDLELRLVTATSTTLCEQPASVSLNARGNAFVANVDGLPQWLSLRLAGRKLGLVPLGTDPNGIYRISSLSRRQGQPHLRLGVVGKKGSAGKSCTLGDRLRHVDLRRGGCDRWRHAGYVELRRRGSGESHPRPAFHRATGGRECRQAGRAHGLGAQLPSAPGPPSRTHFRPCSIATRSSATA